jgi:hypothetical protein
MSCRFITHWQREKFYKFSVFLLFLFFKIYCLKRKIFIILLFFCLIAPVATIFVIFQVQKKQIKREVKWKMISGIDREVLVLLKFTEEEKKNQLKWKTSNEFEYKGEMYDIVEKEVKGDTTLYWCWLDNEETKLNRQYEELVFYALECNPINQENKKQIAKFFKIPFLSEPTEKTAIAFQEINNIYLYDQNFYQSVSSSPADPPPKIV